MEFNQQELEHLLNCLNYYYNMNSDNKAYMIDINSQLCRKIETEMNQAIRNGHAWSKDNTCVTYDPTNNMSAEVFLHGNHIATVTDTDLNLYSGGGWFTNTTKSRLNALIQEFSFKGGIFQKNFNWYVQMFKTVTPFHEGITLPII